MERPSAEIPTLVSRSSQDENSNKPTRSPSNRSEQTCTATTTTQFVPDTWRRAWDSHSGARHNRRRFWAGSGPELERYRKYEDAPSRSYGDAAQRWQGAGCRRQRWQQPAYHRGVVLSRHRNVASNRQPQRTTRSLHG